MTCSHKAGYSEHVVPKLYDLTGPRCSKTLNNHHHQNYPGLYACICFFAAWVVSFGLWLQTQLSSKAGFEGDREASQPTSLPSA